MRRREEEERGEGEGRKKEKLIEKGTSPNELGSGGTEVHRVCFLKS